MAETPCYRTSDRGLYLLILRLSKGQTIKVGRLKETYFKPGYYLYVGRAKRGLKARLARHLKKNKKTFWHIDYLVSKARLVAILIKPGYFHECRMVFRLCQFSKILALLFPDLALLIAVARGILFI